MKGFLETILQKYYHAYQIAYLPRNYENASTTNLKPPN